MEIMANLDDGESSGDVLLERLIHYLICPSFLPQISWTGRGKGKERKFAMSACVQLINFIVITMNKIDKSYNNKKVVGEITYGILKRAPSKFGKSKSSNADERPASAELCDLAKLVAADVNSTKGKDSVSQNCEINTTETSIRASQNVESILVPLPIGSNELKFQPEAMLPRGLPPYIDYWNRYSPYGYGQPPLAAHMQR